MSIDGWESMSIDRWESMSIDRWESMSIDRWESMSIDGTRSIDRSSRCRRRCRNVGTSDRWAKNDKTTKRQTDKRRDRGSLSEPSRGAMRDSRRVVTRHPIVRCFLSTRTDRTDSFLGSVRAR